MNHLVFYLGVFAQNVPFTEMIFFCERVFWDQSWLEQRPPTVFLYLFLTPQILVLHICIHLGNWGVEWAMCKNSITKIHGEFFLSKLATSDPKPGCLGRLLSLSQGMFRSWNDNDEFHFHFNDVVRSLDCSHTLREAVLYQIKCFLHIV